MKTKPTTRSKKNKPYPDFPLFLHATGQWAKKIRQRTHYFGADPDKALAKYLDQRDDLTAGRTPRIQGEGLTVGDLCNRYLTNKKGGVEARELSPRTFADYYRVCKSLVGFLGKTRLVSDLAADDFARIRTELAKVRGAVSLGNEIQRIRGVFKFGYDEHLIDAPVRYGASFKKPNRKTMRLARQAKGSRMFEAKELRCILKAAEQPVRAMVLLGLNCGFGQSDVATLPMSAIDLTRGWIDHPRPKTGIPRRIPLWPETVKAIWEVLRERPQAKAEEDDNVLFITKYGHRWVRTRMHDGAREVPIDSIRLEYNKVLINLGLKRAGGFYNLRHVFRTVADSCRDQPAIDFIMGHARDDMASIYRERIDDSRLTAVTNRVREWLFGRKTR